MKNLFIFGALSALLMGCGDLSSKKLCNASCDCKTENQGCVCSGVREKCKCESCSCAKGAVTVPNSK